MSLSISLQEKNEILELYGLIDEILTPLQKLSQCRFSEDLKYVVYEGKTYSTETGQEEDMILTEGWSLSDILHTGADLASAGMDFIIPGSGAVIDILNALSYVIEAQFKSGEEKDSLYLMAAITFAFVLLPGPLQSVAPALKNAVKTGAGFTSKAVVGGVKIIANSIDFLLLGIPSKISQALKSPLAKNILGKWGAKINSFISTFTSRIKKLLEKFKTTTGKEGAEKAGKEASGNVASKVSTEVPLTKKAKDYKTLADEMNSSFITMNTGKNMSGWKIHVYGESADDTAQLISRLNDSLTNNGVTYKAGTDKFFKTASAGQKNKALTLYLPYDMVANGQQEMFIKELQSKLKGYGKKGTIPSNKDIDGILSYRYEYNVPFDKLPKNGVDIASTTKFYSSAGTDYTNGLVQKDLLGKAVNTAVSKSVKNTIQKTSASNLKNFLTRMPKISKGSFLLRKLGFVAGKPYRYVGKSGKAMTATIKSIDDNQVIVLFKQPGTKKLVSTAVPINTFVQNAVGAPWMRRGYSVLVPLFVKRLADYITSNGDVNYEALAQIPDIDPNLTSKESLAFLQEEVASYEGETGKYTVNTKASSFQNALIALGYPLPKFGADGKFGPETQGALKKFQQENGLTTSLGKMDRLTARKLAELLKSKNKPDTDELQKTLNTI